MGLAERLRATCSNNSSSLARHCDPCRNCEQLMQDAADRIDELLGACKAAIKIESLWMPPLDQEQDPACDHEFAALDKMRQKFLAAISKATGE